jgi:hypothetical protein
MTDSAKELLLAAFEPPGGGRLWHGGNMPEGAVARVGFEEARWIAAPGRRSIWELTLHVAYWRYAVRRRLEGSGERGAFGRSPADWPALPEPADEAGWRGDRRLLAEERARLLGALRAFPAARLSEVADGSERLSWWDIAHGVLLHDVHHAAQITLLRRLWKASR